MIKKIAWNTFKNTGDVNTFLELKQIQKNMPKTTDQKIVEMAKAITDTMLERM